MVWLAVARYHTVERDEILSPMLAVVLLADPHR
jgi:hypothetical protein